MAQGKLSNPSLLNAALEGLELQKARIDEQIREVKSMLGQGVARRGRPASSASASEKPPRKKRVLSVAARKRIASAQKARWAKFRKTAPETEQ